MAPQNLTLPEERIPVVPALQSLFPKSLEAGDHIEEFFVASSF